MEINRSAPNLSSKTSNLIVLLNLSGLTAMGPDDLVYFFVLPNYSSIYPKSVYPAR